MEIMFENYQIFYRVHQHFFESSILSFVNGFKLPSKMYMSGHAKIKILQKSIKFFRLNVLELFYYFTVLEKNIFAIELFFSNNIDEKKLAEFFETKNEKKNIIFSNFSFYFGFFVKKKFQCERIQEIESFVKSKLPELLSFYQELEDQIKAEEPILSDLNDQFKFISTRDVHQSIYPSDLESLIENFIDMKPTKGTKI